MRNRVHFTPPFEDREKPGRSVVHQPRHALLESLETSCPRVSYDVSIFDLETRLLKQVRDQLRSPRIENDGSGRPGSAVVRISSR